MKLLMVCLGNICRSPMAEGALRARIDASPLAGRVTVDSAGTGGWHAGQAPDPRAIACAAGHGVDIAGLRARQLQAADFQRFDLILGMDRSNVDDLRRAAPPEARDRVHLFLDFADGKGKDVPDPYYGGADGFADVYRMIRNASESLADRLERESPPVSGQASSTI